MPSRFAQLPLPAFLAALDEWRRSPGPAARERLEHELAVLVERTGFLGAAMALEAPPLEPAEVAAGSLSSIVAVTSAGDTGDGAEPLVDLPLLVEATGRPLGSVRIHGIGALQDGAVELANAIATAIAVIRDRERARRAEVNLTSLDEAVQGVAQLRDVDLVLQRIVDQVRDLAEADYAALGIVGDDGRIERFLTSGVGPEERARIGHPPEGHGLLGLIIREGRTILVDDIAVDPRSYGFPEHHPEMHPFLGVPIPARGRATGNLYLTRAQPGRPFTADDRQLVERFALHAGIAIENARLHDRVQRLAIVEERERIGRDLHDQIIQRLYGITLVLDDVPELVADDPGEARQRVDDAIESLTATIQEIRTFVFGLQPVQLDERGIRGALEQLAAEVQRGVGLQVSVRMGTGIEPPMEYVAELLSVAREALSNVARHAGATAAELDLTDDGGAYRLEIVDDGQGFDPAAPAGSGHHGLTNMRERAARMGGMVRVASQTGRGTRIIVTLPYRSTGERGDAADAQHDG